MLHHRHRVVRQIQSKRKQFHCYYYEPARVLQHFLAHNSALLEWSKNAKKQTKKLWKSIVWNGYDNDNDAKCEENNIGKWMVRHCQSQKIIALNKTANKFFVYFFVVVSFGLIYPVRRKIVELEVKRMDKILCELRSAIITIKLFCRIISRNDIFISLNLRRCPTNALMRVRERVRLRMCSFVGIFRLSTTHLPNKNLMICFKQTIDPLPQ